MFASHGKDVRLKSCDKFAHDVRPLFALGIKRLLFEQDRVFIEDEDFGLFRWLVRDYIYGVGVSGNG